MNELTTYLSDMDARLATLESENKVLRNALGQVRHNTAARTFKTERGLPDTGLLSDSFWVRAFSVWGHHIVAQLIISIPLVICYFIFILAVMSNFSQ